MGVPCSDNTLRIAPRGISALLLAAFPFADGLNFLCFVGDAVLSFFWLMFAISFHRYVSLVGKRLFRERREPQMFGIGGEIFRREVHHLRQEYNSRTVLTVLGEVFARAFHSHNPQSASPPCACTALCGV